MAALAARCPSARFLNTLAFEARLIHYDEPAFASMLASGTESGLLPPRDLNGTRQRPGAYLLSGARTQ